jgi:hypothetical protein
MVATIPVIPCIGEANVEAEAYLPMRDYFEADLDDRKGFQRSQAGHSRGTGVEYRHGPETIG